MAIEIRAFSHVVLPVSDLDAALAFYRDVLGLEVAMRLEPDDPDSDGSIAAGLRIAGPTSFASAETNRGGAACPGREGRRRR